MLEIEDYFKGIGFKVINRNQGLYIHEARVNSGEEMILRVASHNKGVYLSDLKWVAIWGLYPKEAMSSRLKLQSFTPDTRHCRNKVLYIHERDETYTYYMHDSDPYLVHLVHDRDNIDIYQREDELAMIDAFGTPQFYIKRF